MKKIGFLSVMVLCLAFATMPLLAQSAANGGINIDIPKINVNIPGVPGTTSGTTSGTAIQITDSNQTRTIECKNESVSIMGSDNKITIKGTCTGIQVLGSNNAITVETTPELSIAGSHNSVTVTSVETISVLGSDNSVAWAKGIEKDPTISNLGTNNTVTKSAE